MYAGMHWFDSTNNIEYTRNKDNNAWLIALNQSLLTTSGPTFDHLHLTAGIEVGSAIVSDTADTDDLGSTTKEWKNLYLGTTGKVYFGIGQEANLYLSSTTLKTDNKFQCLGLISIGADFSFIDAGTSDTNAVRLFSNGGILYIQEGSANLIQFRSKTASNIASLDGNGILTVVGYVNSVPSITNPTRALNTVYQNTSGKNIMVYVCMNVAGNALAVQNYAYALIDSNSVPSTIAPNRIGYVMNNILDEYKTLTFMVPSGWYYEIPSAGTVTLNTWEEQVF